MNRMCLDGQITESEPDSFMAVAYTTDERVGDIILKTI